MAHSNRSVLTTMAPGRVNQAWSITSSSYQVNPNGGMPTTGAMAHAPSTPGVSSGVLSSLASAAAQPPSDIRSVHPLISTTATVVSAAPVLDRNVIGAKLRGDNGLLTADAPTSRSASDAAGLSSAATTSSTSSHVAAAAAAAKRKKITYALPNQSMEQGHFYVVLGEDVDVSSGRYKILSLLGQGTFGKVVEAWDRKRKQYCAVKIVRNVPKYTRDAAVEVQFMQRVAAADPGDRYPFVKPWKNFLNDQSHMCIVMPKFGPCLLDWLQRYGPLSMENIADVAYQLAYGLDYLHNDLRLMHTDLKPENILLERSDYTPNSAHGCSQLKIRMCDLGGCTDERHTKYAVVSTRHYRAPEVVLGLGWMYGADMWSVGCILAELFTGRLLFDTHDNLEHLHLMTKILGALPSEWALECYDDAKSLYSVGSLKSPAATSTVKLAKARPLRDVVKDEQLLSLLQSLLCYDKSRRMTPRQMMHHPFIVKYSSLLQQQPQPGSATPSYSKAPSI